jgi:8-oxo-dGTP pyrophosphatase MutT (NUDIX family)
VAELQRLRACEQVAAVCYRIGKTGVEFLLVQTRKGRRWTFPKGSTEPGLTHAQAAALEAFEEAGVHGRMEEAAFARYLSRKHSNARRFGSVEITVNVHLCEVTRLRAPQEANRNPRWFSVEDTKARLQKGRLPDEAEALARVVDRALSRVRRTRSLTRRNSDSLPLLNGQVRG